MVSGYVEVSPPATLRFLLAVLILVFARRTYWELREWRWGKLSPDERFGFSNPMAEPALSSDDGFGHEPHDIEEIETPTVTGSQQPRA